MSQLDEKRGLLYWNFCLAISPIRTGSTFAARLLRILTKINKICCAGIVGLTTYITHNGEEDA
ncbi:hypothetical protein CHU32_13590 [Superficieibacter electus]|uniref:Uncharacterized protein n=1 Tax=Superficieibacter electus TaxID=2022662 RepID=A0A2P5GP36_9ENTR|nr:hypothetical protein CHU33_10665 [Superficieibacter electus]POP48300.1 hypothetical protein CHU32_13590 [Superficieibacter electus]